HRRRQPRSDRAGRHQVLPSGRPHCGRATRVGRDLGRAPGRGGAGGRRRRLALGTARRRFPAADRPSRRRAGAAVPAAHGRRVSTGAVALPGIPRLAWAWTATGLAALALALAVGALVGPVRISPVELAAALLGGLHVPGIAAAVDP